MKKISILFCVCIVSTQLIAQTKPTPPLPPTPPAAIAELPPPPPAPVPPLPPVPPPPAKEIKKEKNVAVQDRLIRNHGIEIIPLIG